jgi:hypothetical protein
MANMGWVTTVMNHPEMQIMVFWDVVPCSLVDRSGTLKMETVCFSKCCYIISFFSCIRPIGMLWILHNRILPLFRKSFQTSFVLWLILSNLFRYPVRVHPVSEFLPSSSALFCTLYYLWNLVISFLLQSKIVYSTVNLKCISPDISHLFSTYYPWFTTIRQHWSSKCLINSYSYMPWN